MLLQLTLETHGLLCSARGVMFYRGQRATHALLAFSELSRRWRFWSYARAFGAIATHALFGVFAIHALLEHSRDAHATHSRRTLSALAGLSRSLSRRMLSCGSVVARYKITRFGCDIFFSTHAFRRTRFGNDI